MWSGPPVQRLKGPLQPWSSCAQRGDSRSRWPIIFYPCIEACTMAHVLTYIAILTHAKTWEILSLFHPFIQRLFDEYWDESLKKCPEFIDRIFCHVEKIARCTYRLSMIPIGDVLCDFRLPQTNCICKDPRVVCTLVRPLLFELSCNWRFRVTDTSRASSLLFKSAVEKNWPRMEVQHPCQLDFPLPRWFIW